MNTYPAKSFLFAAVVAVAGFASAAAQAASSIIDGVSRNKVAGIDLIAKRTAVKDVVIIAGVLPAGDIFNPEGKSATAMLTAEMLDKGTTKNDKFALSRKLEEIGASIGFGAGGVNTSFQASCMKEDLPLVLSLLAEQLRMPSFSAEEFEKMKTQTVGGLQQELDDPGARAGEAFGQLIYPQGHPNRGVTTQQQIDAVKAAKLEDLKAFHAAHYGPERMTMIVAGDIDMKRLTAEIQKTFGGWKGGTAAPAASRSAVGYLASGKEETVVVPGKTSVNVLLGQASGLRYRDPEAIALRVGTAILGSGFTGRLMKNVRDKEGLTYGIGAGVSGDAFADGDWKINATFAPALLDKGVASARRVLNEWYTGGVTSAELEQRKEQLVGNYYVGLATTEGIAGAMLNAIQRGLDLSWLDEYPKVIQSLTVDQVNSAIKKHLDPNKMLLIKSGTVEEKKS